jgi:hypothetical protein
MSEAKELADAVVEAQQQLDSFCRRLLLRRVTPSDAHILTVWLQNTGIQLRAANQLLEELPKKSP